MPTQFFTSAANIHRPDEFVIIVQFGLGLITPTLSIERRFIYVFGDLARFWWIRLMSSCARSGGLTGDAPVASLLGASPWYWWACSLSLGRHPRVSKERRSTVAILRASSV